MSLADRDEEQPERRRVSARDVAVWGARTTGGLIGVGIAVLVVVGSLFVAPPTWSIDPPALEVVPQAAAEQLVCAGPALRLADDAGQNASDASPLGPPSVAFSGDAEAAISTIGRSDASGADRGLAPQVALVEPEGTTAPVVAGIQSQLPTTGDLRGLTTTSCVSPSLRSWLVAGSTELGRTSILTLTNPSNVEAVVDLELYGDIGPIASPGLSGIVVPAGSQRVIPVNGFTLEQRSPVIGVTSSGGNVAAFLQSSVIRTLTPGGLDLSGGQTASETLVVPGVRIAGEAALQPLIQSQADVADTQPMVRLLSPGADTTATVAVFPTGTSLADALVNSTNDAIAAPSDSPTVPPSISPRSFDVQLTRGVVAETAIPLLAAGEYTIVVLADEPVVGAVRAGSIGTAGTDFAWFSPAAELGATAALPAAAVGGSALSLVNLADEPVAATIVPPSGRAVPLTVPAGGALLVPLTPGADYALSGTSGLRAAVTGGQAGWIGQAVLQPPAPSARPVTVTP